MNETFFVAVDGGGTGTRVRAYLPNRVLLGEADAGPSSLTLGVESAWNNIKCAIEMAVSETPYSKKTPNQIVAGLAGSRNLKQQQAFLKQAGTEVDLSHCTIDIVSDAYTSALGALSGQSGIVVAIGTGLGACAINKDLKPQYVSGWGFKVGDEGAGSWIGLQAVQAYLKFIDGRTKGDSKVYGLIGASLGTTAMTIQQWCLTANATDFARFAKTIAELAKQNDALAMTMMRQSATEVLQVINAYDNIDAKAPIVFLGGLGKAMQPYLPEDIRARFKEPKGNSLDGASGIVFGDYPTEVDEDTDILGYL